MTRHAVSVVLVCAGIAASRPAPGATKVALIGHFDQSPGAHLLRWIAPAVARIFRPGGVALDWYADRGSVPDSTGAVLDVWFHGDCRRSETSAQLDAPAYPVRLGWVVAVDGRIGHDISIDCTAIMRVAGEAAVSAMHRGLLDAIFVRLLERVLGHEVLHVLLGSAGHGTSELTLARIEPGVWEQVGRLTPAEIREIRELYGKADLVRLGRH